MDPHQSRIDQRQLLYNRVTHAALIGLGVNLALAAVKLTGGIIGQSFALIADAVNSLGDVVTTVVVLIALRVAQKPPDEEHPYGHSRAEGIAATNVALVIIMSAGIVIWEAAHHFWLPHTVPPAWTIWIAGLNVIIKEGLYQYKMRIGRKTGSAAIIANAWDHRADAFCAGAVLLGLTGVRYGGPSWMWADEAASIVVGLAIIWSGIELFRKSGSQLMDVQAEAGLVDAIREVARKVPGVADVETLWVRKSGLEYFADIHIEVPAHLTVAAGHRIGHLVKDQLLHRFVSLRDVLVHLEPCPHTHDFSAEQSHAASETGLDASGPTGRTEASDSA